MTELSHYVPNARKHPRGTVIRTVYNQKHIWPVSKNQPLLCDSVDLYTTMGVSRPPLAAAHRRQGEWQSQQAPGYRGSSPPPPQLQPAVPTGNAESRSHWPLAPVRETRNKYSTPASSKTREGEPKSPQRYSKGPVITTCRESLVTQHHTRGQADQPQAT